MGATKITVIRDGKRPGNYNDAQYAGVRWGKIQRRAIYIFRARATWIAAWCISNPSVAFCQAPKLPDNPVQGAANSTSATNPLDSYQFYLSVIVILFGVFVMVGQMLMLRRVTPLGGDDIARNCVITIVTTAALVLVIAGYSSGQIAPAFGLFGTIVGYLLGRANRPPSPRSDREAEASAGGTENTTQVD